MTESSKKIAIITGAGEGIGRGVARHFARQGIQVIIAEINEAKGTQAAADIEAAGGAAAFIATDVSDKNSIQNLIDKTVADFGGIDILVNNAVALPQDILLENKTDEMLAQQLNVGVWGSWWAMQAVRPVMAAAGSGSIINFSSLDIETGSWFHSDYSIAKAGIQALTRSAAMEWARYKIRVNCVMPIAASAAFDRMCDGRPGLREAANMGNPLGRMGDPELDIAPAVAFLAGDDAHYITGVSLPVDGGLHLPRINNKPQDLSIYEN
jgi:NAD(P)-dependent dehydrogenase (short-subunit alcohol dehydrogenase family)